MRMALPAKVLPFGIMGHPATMDHSRASMVACRGCPALQTHSICWHKKYGAPLANARGRPVTAPLPCGRAGRPFRARSARGAPAPTRSFQYPALADCRSAERDPASQSQRQRSQRRSHSPTRGATRRGAGPPWPLPSPVPSPHDHSPRLRRRPDMPPLDLAASLAFAAF